MAEYLLGTNAAKPATLRCINESGLLLYLDAGNKSSYPGTGATWKDLSGNGYNATLVHSPAFDAHGWFTFDGANDYGYTTATPFTANTDFTIAAWVKNSATAETKLIVGNKGYYALGEGASIQHANSPKDIFVIIKTNVSVYNKPVYVGATYNWTYVVMIRSSNTLMAYKNGVMLDAPTALSGTVTDSTNFFGIATRPDTPELMYPGSIGQILVYQRALSAAEILQNYNATKGRFGL